MLAQRLPLVTACFRQGGGVPYAAFRPDFTEAMDASWRLLYDGLLLRGFLPRVPGLPDRAMGLPNVRFEVLDATHLPDEPKFDLITSFDAIHDQRDPATALRRIAAALAPDGLYLMIEPKASSHLEDIETTAGVATPSTLRPPSCACPV